MASAALVVAAQLAACSPPNIVGQRKLGAGYAMGTAADMRLVTTVPATIDGGRAVPRMITCAEPSADVAKAVSTAMSLSGALDGAAEGPNVPAKIDVSTALALSTARAESLAQMTNRMATIQLLRDGLFRACEAYQNGAISDTTYAVLLSRYDNVMVTMLLGELAAGNFGQSLATLAMTASGNADSNAGGGSGGGSGDAGGGGSAPATNASTTQAADSSGGGDGGDESSGTGSGKRSARANSNVNVGGTATAVSAVALASAADQKRSEVLGTMQRKYIENINFDPIVVACLTALDRRQARFYQDGVWTTDGGPAADTKLVELCQSQLGALLAAEKSKLDSIVRPIATDEAQRRELRRLLTAVRDDAKTTIQIGKEIERSGREQPSTKPAILPATAPAAVTAASH